MSKEKATLKALERLILPTLMPKEASFIEQLAIQDLTKKISFDQEEATELEIKNTEDGKLTWNAEKDSGKEVEFTEAEVSLVKKVLEELDNDNKVTADMLNLFKIFV